MSEGFLLINYRSLEDYWCFLTMEDACIYLRECPCSGANISYISSRPGTFPKVLKYSGMGDD